MWEKDYVYTKERDFIWKKWNPMKSGNGHSEHNLNLSRLTQVYTVDQLRNNICSLPGSNAQDTRSYSHIAEIRKIKTKKEKKNGKKFKT